MRPQAPNSLLLILSIKKEELTDNLNAQTWSLLNVFYDIKEVTDTFNKFYLDSYYYYYY